MDRYFRWFRLPGALVLTLLMSLLSLALALFFRTPVRRLCLAAMLLSSLGDVVLMNYRGLMNGFPVPKLYVGALCFAAAHVLYALAFSGRIRAGGYAWVNTGFWCGVALTAASAAALVVLFLRGRAASGVTPATLAVGLTYLLFIGAACAVILSCAASRAATPGLCGKRTLLAAVGAVAFFASDFIIGLNAVGGLKPSWYDRAIWWLYPLGQILLQLGA